MARATGLRESEPCGAGACAAGNCSPLAGRVIGSIVNLLAGIYARSAQLIFASGACAQRQQRGAGFTRGRSVQGRGTWRSSATLSCGKSSLSTAAEPSGTAPRQEHPASLHAEVGEPVSALSWHASSPSSCCRGAHTTCEGRHAESEQRGPATVANPGAGCRWRARRGVPLGAACVCRAAAVCSAAASTPSSADTLRWMSAAAAHPSPSSRGHAAAASA